MSDLTESDPTPPSTVTAHPVGEEKAARRGQVVAQYRHADRAAAQNGLQLYFQDGLPLPPAMTRGRRAQLSLKRGLDLLGALVLLILWLPLMLGLAATIRLSSPGPVLFRQQRVGKDGRLFAVLKFRTMFAAHSDPSGVRQTIADDERITTIGRVMRRLSLDELPQLLNVLRGEMSLVGPRPHVPGQLAAGQPYAEVVAYYNLRHGMRPGITGWAQVNGYRGPTDTLQRAVGRVDHDLAYIQNFSLGLDLAILVLTVRREFLTGSGL